MPTIIDRRISFLFLGLIAFTAAPAGAATGDVHRVSNADTVNLRAGPSDESKVRGTVTRGSEVIELTREGSWLGIRVLRTGEEGWIFEQLMEPVTRSALGNGGPAVVEDVGFLRWSDGFNRLLRSINTDLRYPTVRTVEQSSTDSLRVTPTTDWLVNGSRDAHLMGAAAMYQMWKNHQNGAPVRLIMTDDRGQDYISIIDDGQVPNLSIVVPERP
jgi:uncharacterized protein YgiM (DUF1202 family)